VTVTAVEAPRAVSLPELVDLLTKQHASKCDLIVPATKIRARNGRLVVSAAPLVMDEDGVTDPNGTYDVADTCDDGISEKLSVPRAFLRRMHEERPDVWDMLVNRLIQGGTVRRDGEETVYPADARTFLLRTFVTEDRRVARALLSDRYEIVDNLDVLVAVLGGVKDSGQDVDVHADVTDRRMYVRLVAPGVQVLAADLLRNYRSPFASPDVQRAGRLADLYGEQGGAHAGAGSQNPDVVNAGLVIKNSEIGDGGWSITPRAEFLVCRNGLTVKADMIRGIHLGGKKTEGVITWSDEVRRQELALVVAKTREAVAKFLDPAYVEAQLDKIREDMGTAVSGAERHVQAVAKKLAFTPDVMQGVLDHFILGGQMTSGGVMQAVTSYAQTVSDADLAAELEELALDVLGTSASLARSAR
jgi:hypothetical protein